jgi:molybdopterin synthase sulfur carrier subunit
MVVSNRINHGSWETVFYLNNIQNKMELLIFGSLTDIIGTDKIVLETPLDTELLKASLLKQYPSLEKMHYFLALNKIMVQEKQPLQEGDVVALMPAFSGG